MHISPWALREGIIMRKLDLLDTSEEISLPGVPATEVLTD